MPTREGTQYRVPYDNRCCMNLKDYIASAVKAQIDAAVTSAVSEALEAGERETVKADRYSPRRVEPIERTTRSRRSFPSGPQVAYVVNGRAPKAITAHRTAEIVWKWIAGHARPQSNDAIETGTGLKEKTVESSVWWLRNHDREGNRVKPGSRAALIVSSDV